jgi:hypothetical protein
VQCYLTFELERPDEKKNLLITTKKGDSAEVGILRQLFIEEESYGKAKNGLDVARISDGS